MSTESTCDVIVVGTGAAGLSAALTARLKQLDVLLVDKEEYVGGTSALSAGWLWIPGNPHARANGVDDSIAEARRYIAHEAGELFDHERVEAFLQYGPEMLGFLEIHTSARFQLGTLFPDYHPAAPGGKSGGRSVSSLSFDGRLLGRAIRMLRPPLQQLTLFGMMIESGNELRHFYDATRSARSLAHVACRVVRYVADWTLYRRDMRLVNGNALVGRLLKSAIDLRIPISLSSRVVSLVADTHRIAGALIETPTGIMEVRARRGVVLATGGFSHDLLRRKQLFPHCRDEQFHWSQTPQCASGDGIRLAEAAGGYVVEGYRNAASWVPVSLVPTRNGRSLVFPHFRDRCNPGVIAVDREGRRFTNEADSYHDFVQAMLRTAAEEKYAWLIADKRAVARYGLGAVRPIPLSLHRHLRSGYLIEGASLLDLAQRIGVDPKLLDETVTRFNAHAVAGFDPDFHRGGNAYNIFLGDSRNTPNPSLGALEHAPFYAIKMLPGDIGTFAGLRTDHRSQVLDHAGRGIKGLYAAGNDAASIAGGSYPGSGSNLGPAMTFAYIAAKSLAEG